MARQKKASRRVFEVRGREALKARKVCDNRATQLSSSALGICGLR